MNRNLAEHVTREQILAALEHIQKNNVQLNESKKFDLEFNGRKFPPKEVVREAAKLAGISNLSDYRLNGGPPTNGPLQKMGFTITSKNDPEGTGPSELMDALSSYLNSTAINSEFGNYRYTEKNDTVAMGTRGGTHDAGSYPGYIFTSDANQLLFRFIKAGETCSIAVENLKRRTQLANFSVATGKTFFSEGGVIQLRENYKLTVVTRKPYRVNRDAMIRSGFPANDIILMYEDPVEEARVIIGDLLRWAEIREKAKELIRNEEEDSQQHVENPSLIPAMELNTILYGPPGTGKTYHTIDKALEIVDWEYYETYKGDRDKLVERFRELLITDFEDPAGKIAFVTFHQSMSYEDFIEGIKPDIIEGDDSGKEDITYDIKDGIFKLIAEKASWRKGNFDEVFEGFKNKIDETRGGQPISISSKYTTFRVIYRGTTVLYVNPKNSKKENAWYPVSIVNIRKVYETGNYKGVYNFTYVREILEYLKRQKGLVEPSASEKPEPHVIIIDEINRGNVAQIFGELITLLEPDKRANGEEALEVILPYSKRPFSIPGNLYVIGTMNTADRSVEALDTALRRRFCFEAMPPLPGLLTPERMLWKFWWDNKEFSWEDKEYIQLETPFYELLGFPKVNQEEKARYWDPLWEERVPNEKQIDSLKELVSSFDGVDLSRLLTRINQRIGRLLSKDHLIGHAYFINVGSIKGLKSIMFNKLIPLLQEYFYADYGRIGLVIGAAFLEIEKKGQVKFMKVDGYEAGDFNEGNVYHLRKPEDFGDDEFISAIKAIYE